MLNALKKRCFSHQREIIKRKMHLSCVCEINPKGFSSKLSFASCVLYFDRACHGVCIPSWRIQVGGFPANARVNRTKTFSLVLRTETVYNPLWGGQNQAWVEFSMHETIRVIVWVSFWSGLLGSTGFVRKFLCAPCICGRPTEVQPRRDAGAFTNVILSYLSIITARPDEISADVDVSLTTGD